MLMENKALHHDQNYSFKTLRITTEKLNIPKMDPHVGRASLQVQLGGPARNPE